MNNYPLPLTPTQIYIEFLASQTQILKKNISREFPGSREIFKLFPDGPGNRKDREIENPSQDPGIECVRPEGEPL